jgi:hypothetical protein
MALTILLLTFPWAALVALLNWPSVVTLVVLSVVSSVVAVASIISANHSGVNNPIVKLSVASTIVPEIPTKHGGASRT